jgi:hypothetical protein
MTNYTRPGIAGSLMSYESRYGNHIGGEWVPPVEGLCFDNPTPVTVGLVAGNRLDAPSHSHDPAGRGDRPRRRRPQRDRPVARPPVASH